MKTNTHTLYAFDSISNKWYRYNVVDGDVTGSRTAVTEEEVESARSEEGVEVNEKEESEKYEDDLPF